MGLFFTFVSLLVISASTTKEGEENLTTQLATGVQEEAGDNN